MTKSELDIILKRKGYSIEDNSKNTRPRTYSKFQECKDNLSKQSNHKAVGKGSNGQDHPKYRITITWLVSDKRIRDSDGMLATINDCIVHATRRLAGLDDRKFSKGTIRIKRTRRLFN